MDIYARTALAIIRAQEGIIGPIAIKQASSVPGLRFINGRTVSISGDEKKVIADLVKKYEIFFGQASIEVCKDAIRELKPPVPVDMLPDNLK